MDLESLNGGFWIGLRSMHCLTSKGNWELQIDYQLKNGTESYLHYNKFAVASAEDRYQLNISGFDSIGLIDPSSYVGQTLNGMKFTPHDQDNDLLMYECASGLGGFWYNGNHCGAIRINNKQSNVLYFNGQWHNSDMKIRPQN